MRNHSTTLMVRREGEPRGVWPFRRAAYSVYADAPAGQRLIILQGSFPDHHAALNAALRKLDQPLGGAPEADRKSR